MKSILISIKPKWVVKILNGEKTIEVRKSMPKCDLPIDVFIYCSKGNKKDWHLIEVIDTDTRKQEYEYDYYIGSKGYLEHCLEGKVVAKFTLNKVEKIMSAKTIGVPINYTDSLFEKDLCKKSCLTPYDFNDYLKANDGYAWYISNLVIFDKPKELRELRRKTDLGFGGYKIMPLLKAPQSMCYIESEN